VRYLKTGRGPNLVLFHTLRTQLDIYKKIIPKLAEQFTVDACDYPGHGWSAELTELIVGFVARDARPTQRMK